MSIDRDKINVTTPQIGQSASTGGLEAAPSNSLPTWGDCAIRVDNSDYIEKRVSEGGYGADGDSLLATQLHRFIYEYDDADAYRSAWFLHRLELVIDEAKREASNGLITSGVKNENQSAD